MSYENWEVVRDFKLFRNVAGTNFDDGNDGGWIDLLTNIMEPRGISVMKCIVKECPNNSTIGAHIELIENGQIGIVPMCNRHNNLKSKLGINEKKRNYAAYVMPLWRCVAIKIAEQIYLGNMDKDVIVNNVRYTMIDNDFIIIIRSPNTKTTGITKYPED